MKNTLKFQIAIFLGFSFSQAWSQQVQVITADESRTRYENKSYLVVKSLTLGNGFKVNAATDGTWYAKAHPNAVPPVAPSSDQNFVRIESVLKSGVTTESQLRSLTIADKSTGYSYMDGMGRTLQSTVVGASPSLNDVVQPVYYDAQGRSSRQYLPYAATGTPGSYRSNALTDQGAFYNSPPAKVPSDSRAYGEITFDNSPLSRATQAVATGSAWSSKPVINNLKINDAATVPIWQVSNNLPISTSTYPAGSLTISEVINEEGIISRTYKDFLGRTVLQEVQTTVNRWAQTYYVYSINGNLLFIIPPAAAATLNPDQAFADRWYFQNEYDEYQRQIGAKAPGAGWIYSIYDQWDRPVLSQDAVQRLKSPAEWGFVKYDDLNRPIASGIYRTTDTRATLTTTLATFLGRYEIRNSSSVAYTLNQTFPTTVTEDDLLTVNYYDDYGYLSNINWDAQNKSFSFVPEPGFTGVVFSSVKDRVTGSKIRILNTNTWLNSVTYFDNRYRPFQTIIENQFEQLDRITSELNFTGQVLKAKRVHTNSTQSFAMQERYTYDVSGRLLNTYHQLNSQTEILLASLEYNELGQLIDKKIHSTNNGSSWLQSMDLRYNIRGWATNINNTTIDAGDPADYFGMELAYNNAQSGNMPRYDGSISGSRIKHDLSSKDRIYNYTYDKGTLTSSAYKVDNTANTQAGVYNESVAYDLNGNIQTLNRNFGLLAPTTIDQLTYDYSASGGNQLMKVTDATGNTQGFNDGNTIGDDYAYDSNGNVTKDLNKGISSIIYNLLNLPERVNFSNGSYTFYQYNAGGAKLNQAYFNSSNVPQGRVDYEGEFLYIDGQPQLIFHSQGRLVSAAYANLISNTATREANTLEGYTANGSVTLTVEAINTETYIKAVSNQTGSTPGVWPIGGTIAVKAGESYSYKVLGYQSVGTNAYLYVWGTNGDIIWTGGQLPVGSAGEDWVTTTFTVPAGVTQIKVGVLWSNAVSGNIFYINRVALYKTDWEYQYFLSDHLGSPRVVLQTSPNTNTYTATMESQNYATENEQFLNLASNREIPLSLANATPGGAFAYVMNSTYHVGPARNFKVLPGDKIDASVMAYYPSGGTYNKTVLTSMASFVASALAGGVAGTIDGVVSTSYNSSGTNSNFLLSPDQGTGRPSAFINYILFDETYTPIEAKSQAVGSTAGVLHSVVLPQINVTQIGYLYVYLTYDNEAGGMDVYFDDFKITYQESPVVQVNGYYPYGLAAYSWIREGEQETKEKFQGKQYDEKTGWHDFGSRQYAADLGRWFAVDPKNQFASPYTAMGNNPVMMVDPNGEFAFVPVLIGAIMGAYMGGTIANGGQMNPTKWDYNSGRTWGYMGAGALIGGLSGGYAGQVAMSGAPFANTNAIMVGSFLNSVGTAIYTGGQTGVSISFGVASYNFTQNDWGFLGERGNSTLENIGYGFGALANIQDIVAGTHGTNVDVKARPKLAGHSETTGTYNGKAITISVGPDVDLVPKINSDLGWEWEYVKRSLKWNPVRGENVSYIRSGDPQIVTRLNNVNGKWLQSMTKRLNSGRNLIDAGSLKYGLLNGCVNYNARALFGAGIINVNALLPITAPVLLNAELAIRQIGIYASPYLTTYR